MNKTKHSFIQGFTLIEIMIVFAVIAIIAVIAIPTMARAKMNANETNAIGTLRSLSASQTVFQKQTIVDQNQNGKGEFGLLGELTGTVKPRSKMGIVKFGFITTAIEPLIDRAYSSKAGYLLEVFLAGDPNVLTDNGVIPAPDSLDPSVVGSQEDKWFAYSWPINLHHTGVRVFFVDHSGVILEMSNEQSRYSGANAMPEYNSIFRVGDEPSDDKYLDGDYGIGRPSKAVGGEAWYPIR